MADLENYLHSLNPQPNEQSILIYGSQYHCWLNKRYIGIFIWRKDEYIGDSFQRNDDGTIHVATPDRWELIIEK